MPPVHIFTFVPFPGSERWEQKVQFRTSSWYVAAVAIMRAFEIAARSATLAVFSGRLTHPYGFFWSLAADYCGDLSLAVDFTLCLCVALPLVLVSVEPLVWRREDHADSYYLVRVAEFVVMWTVIIHKQAAEQEEASETSVLGCEARSYTCLGIRIYPFVSFKGSLQILEVWRIARQHELCRDVADWSEDLHCGNIHL
eukprot:Skav211116  [mRNA]  locus=scaffold2290:62628:66104:- [translate_table: standard]